MIRLALSFIAFVAMPGFTADLNEQTFEHWRDYIRPAPAELRWLKIPWRSSVWPALLEARTADKPLLIWAMNGHPLACT